VNKPRFFRKSFLPTIAAFAMLDGAYPAVAMFVVCKLHWPRISDDLAMANVAAVLGLSVVYHSWAYWAYTHLADGKIRKLLAFRLVPSSEWTARLTGARPVPW
jgi:hypothetical protein